MAQNTTNTTAFIEAEQYSNFILAALPGMELPDIFWRDISDFSSGTTLNIKSVGAATLQDLEEDVEPTFNAIDTSTITLTISEFKGDAWSISDKLREDGAQIAQLSGMRAMEAARAVAAAKETDFWVALNAGQIAAHGLTDVSLTNGRPHRWVAGGAGAATQLMTQDDLIAMKLSFDKANAPGVGRVAVVDPLVEASVNKLATMTAGGGENPRFEGLIQTGFATNNHFIRHLFGWDIYTSNRLPVKTATEALDASTYGLANDTAEIGDVANIFMCLADDGVKPGMYASRRSLRTEGWRDHGNEQDKFKVSVRYGFGAQRVDSLGIIYTHGTNY